MLIQVVMGNGEYYYDKLMNKDITAYINHKGCSHMIEGTERIRPWQSHVQRTDDLGQADDEQ